MIASERRKKIMHMINSYGSIRAADLAKSMSVSTETIRKDLLFLNNKGLVQKRFGGAVAVNEFVEQPVVARSMENQEAKQNIAARAVELIEGNNVIFIDSGSTLLCLARILPSDRSLAVVTNSFMAVEHLINSNHFVFFVGGEVSGTTMATSGFWADYSLNSLKIDVAFLGSSGFQSHNGPCSKTFSDIQFKMEVIKNSSRIVVLADSSKFSSNAIGQYTDWSMVDVLVTNVDAPDDLVQPIAKKTQVVKA
ncbi:MAG: DeoR/GlpR family DNA-binding transcription regulator [Planctomycetes bacterium]|nr:DeoR/GlpR family DNA-binding transcription regulator [Planctomycetota bacterium]